MIWGMIVFDGIDWCGGVRWDVVGKMGWGHILWQDRVQDIGQALHQERDESKNQSHSALQTGIKYCSPDCDFSLIIQKCQLLGSIDEDIVNTADTMLVMINSVTIIATDQTPISLATVYPGTLQKNKPIMTMIMTRNSALMMTHLNRFHNA